MPKIAALPPKNVLNDKTVKDLKELCAKRDIPQAGSKDDLIKKLLSYQKQADKAAAVKDVQKAASPKADAVRKAAEEKAAAERAAAEEAAKKAAEEEAKRKAEEEAAAKKAAEEKAAAEAAARKASLSIAPSVMVTIQGLSKAELNGKRAEVKQWLMQEGRWQCRVTEDDSLLNFRPRNIVPDECPASQVDLSKKEFLGQCVLLHDLVAKPELNGQFAEVLGWLGENGRWKCKIISSGEEFNFKPANLTQTRPEVDEPAAKRQRLNPQDCT
mmetsp:Transcript_168456/g.298583  ORF Transcript_168456/g.298583 Transcript_168456/m.298583 type:complete len:271 (-) Transcript_168456:76-888(-)